MILPLRLEGVGWSWIRAPSIRPFKDYWSTGFSHEPPVQRYLVHHAHRIIQDGERRPRLLDVGSRYGLFGVLGLRLGCHVAVVEADRRNVVRIARRLTNRSSAMVEVVHQRVPFDGFDVLWRWSDVVKIDVDGSETDLMDEDLGIGPRAVTLEIHRNVGREWVEALISRFDELGYEARICADHRSTGGSYVLYDGELPEAEYHLGLSLR